MATLDFVQTNFTRGELSPRIRGRIDFQGYYNGVEELNNFIVLPLGGITKRPGTRFISEVISSSAFSRLIPFQFNVDENYALEFGSGMIRFFADGGQLVSNNVATTFDNPDFSNGLTGWTDQSNGTGSVVSTSPASGFLQTGDAAGFESDGSGNEAILEQSVSVDPADQDVIHSLRLNLDVENGTKSLKALVRVGSTSGGNDIFEREMNIGSHVVDIDPQGNSPLYVQIVQESDSSVEGSLLVHYVDFLRGDPIQIDHYFIGNDSINWTQSADVLFLTHPAFTPKELRRFGRAEFSLVPFDFRDGPYGPVNLTDTTLTPSSISGRVTVTASSTDGINDGQGFIAEDEGRMIRLKTTKTESKKVQGNGTQTQFTFGFYVPDTESLTVTLTNTGTGGVTQNIAQGATVEAFEGQDYSVTLNNPDPGGTVDFSISKAPSNDIEVTILRDIAFWGWGEIVRVVNSTEVEVLVRGTSGLGSASATEEWRLGDWSGDLGWPHVATFHNERLTFGGSAARAQNLWFSQVADFNSFTPTATDGTVSTDNAITITLATSQVNFIRWLSSINNGLAVGTSGAEFLIRSATATDPLGPTSIEAIRQTTRGSAGFVPTERVGLSTIFVQRGNETVRELSFDFNVDGLVARDFSLVSEHLLKPGIKRMAYQQNPDSILWLVRQDNRLLGFTLESDQEVFAWHRHTIGGQFGDRDAEVESTTITTQDGLDRLWMIVKRTINGNTKRYVEYMEFPWRNAENPIEDAFFVDSGLTGDFTGAPQSIVSGLDHLEGETVKVLADGATHPDRTVSGGSISLDRDAEKVQVGLGYTASVQTFPLDEGVRGEISRGKVKRISELHLLFHETVGALFGRTANNLDRLPFRDSSIPMNQPVPPFSGLKSFRMPMRHDALAFVRVESDQPLPATVLNITGEMEFYDT